MSSESKFKGVILAAGRGSRIAPLSGTLPKSLLPVCNKPILQYQLEALRRIGIDEIVIVTGHMDEAVRAEFGDGSSLGVHIDYVFDAEPQGIASSLLKAEALAGDAFALFLGDIFFSVTNLEAALEQMANDAGAVIVARLEDDPAPVSRNFAVIADESNRIQRVVEKPAHPPSLLKGVGLYFFRASIFDAIRSTPRSALRNEYELTDSIQTLVDAGEAIFVHEMEGWEMNVTYPVDLLECNLRVLREQGLTELVGEGSLLEDGVRLHSSVLGDRVKVGNGFLIEESLILPDAILEGAEKYINRSIIGPTVQYVAR